jgi:hypothetical protein
MLKYWMIGAAGAALLAATSLTANAAPASNAAGLRTPYQDTSAVEKAARRCWWRNGVRRCTSRRGARVYGYRRYRSYDGYARPEDLPTGSTAWWRSMDYYDRGGFGRGR